MKRNGFLAEDQLPELGFAALGANPKIDTCAVFYSADRIALGADVRIDAGAVLSAGPGGIVIGDHVHISAHVFMGGAAKIAVGNFTSVSVGTSIFSSNDDYRGAGLTGPTVPDNLRNVTDAPVVLAEHTVIGAGCVILPGVTIGKGAAVGALTCLRKDVPPFVVVAGPHGHVIGERSRHLLRLEQELRRREVVDRS